MSSAIALCLAFLLDILLGEPRRFHPLIGFGNLTNKLAGKFNADNRANRSALKSRLLGIGCWLLLVSPLPLIYFFIYQDNWLFWCLDAVIVYAAVGYNSLVLHAKNILTPLKHNNLSQARLFCSYIVSRNTTALTEQEIARATVESVLENGHDAVIAPLVWFAIGGAPLVILHRLANTLDAMWGYKNQRFIYFGWCAARMDDLLGWPTAKVTSVLYACQGGFRGGIVKALYNGYRQGRVYKSLNGGWVMATGATVLNITLGGSAIYHGKSVQSAVLGRGPIVSTAHIASSLQLVKTAALVFIACYFCGNFFFTLSSF